VRGLGVRAVVEGRDVVVGSVAMLRAADVTPTDGAHRAAAAIQDAGRGTVMVAADGAVIGVLGLRDTLRASTAGVIASLRRAGVRRIAMLTGDTARSAAPVALLRDDLGALPEALRIARATRRVIAQNVAIALATVAGLLAGVLAGEVHMALGMLVHQGSVLLVVANALRITRGGNAKQRGASPTEPRAYEPPRPSRSGSRSTAAAT
jgi:cation transport ATPase